MDKALYIAMTGAKHNMLSQTAHANNLANVNTTGFKSDFTQARSMPVYYGDGAPTRAYALTENPATNFSSGPMVQTGRDLDVAIEGEGFISVQAPDGSEAYTRAGSLHVDSVGILRTGNGLPVLGGGGPIAIPAAETIEVAVDGTITIVPLGLGADAVANIDRIKLVNPDVAEMRKGSDGLFRSEIRDEPFPADANVRLLSGFLEGSNVNAVDAMTSVINLARQYEMHVKVMQTVKENSETSARLMQMQS